MEEILKSIATIKKDIGEVYQTGDEACERISDVQAILESRNTVVSSQGSASSSYPAGALGVNRVLTGTAAVAIQ